jgi:hypothetical protein
MGRYRKLLKRYREIRATNEYLHSTYSKATRVSSQLSNENAYSPLAPNLTNSNILDFLVGMEQRLPLTDGAKKALLNTDLPDEPVDLSQFDYDAHFGYSPTPSPPPEVANQLTQEQIDMSMFKVEPGSVGLPGTMGPPQPVAREESVDAFKGRRPVRTSGAGLGVFPSSRKRKDRDSEGEDNGGSLGRKKTRG